MASLQLSCLTVYFLVTNFLITAGVIYGWTGLQRQLRDEKQFRSSSCPSTGTCDSEEYQLSLIPIVAFNLANVATVVHGIALDRFGVRANAVCGGLLFTIGMLFLSVSDSATFNAFIPAYTLLGWGGIAVFLSSFQFANLYSKPVLWRAVINALFTTAGITFTIIEWLNQSSIPRDYALGVYASVAAALTVGMLAMYPIDAYEEGDECSLPVVEWYTGSTRVRRHQLHSKSDASLEAETRDDLPSEWSTAAANVEGAGLGLPHDVPLDGDGEGIGHAYERGGFLNRGSTSLKGTDTPSLPPSGDHRKATATLWEEVKDPQTILLALFFSFGLLFSNWFNATIGTQLTNMGDGDGHWAIAFIFISSFLPIAFAVLIAHWFKTIGYSGAVFICTLTLAMSYLPLYTDVLGMQWMGFLFYTLSRALVITTMFSYAATQYRPDHYGRIVAVVTVVATPIGFLLLLMQQQSTELGYRGINTICAVGVLVMLLYSWYLKRKGM